MISFLGSLSLLITMIFAQRISFTLFHQFPVSNPESHSHFLDNLVPAVQTSTSKEKLLIPKLSFSLIFPHLFHFIIFQCLTNYNLEKTLKSFFSLLCYILSLPSFKIWSQPISESSFIYCHTLKQFNINHSLSIYYVSGSVLG